VTGGWTFDYERTPPGAPTLKFSKKLPAQYRAIPRNIEKYPGLLGPLTGSVTSRGTATNQQKLWKTAIQPKHFLKLVCDIIS
jgi:hypothetical protein